MTIERLFTQNLEILPYEESGTDGYNDPVPGFGNPIAVMGYLEQRGADEETEDRETSVSTHTVFLPESAPLGHRDRIRHGDDTYEVVGKPNRLWHPRLAAYHHLEADLVQIKDEDEEGGS